MPSLSALLLLLLPALCAAQTGGDSITVVRVDGARVVLTGDTLRTLPRRSAQLTVHGTTTTVEGTSVREMLLLAGAGPLDTLRGPLLRRVVVVVGADGYRVVLPLSDLDPSLGVLDVLLVDRENGAPLSLHDGPWRVAIPADRRAARSVRSVVRFDIIDLP